MNAMSKTHLFTISPFDSPFTLNSRAHGSDERRKFVDFVKQLKSVQDSFDLVELDWGDGYGTTKKDLLPLYFRPLFELKLKTLPQDPDIHACRLIFYDDQVAILFLFLKEENFELSPAGDFAAHQRSIEFFQQHVFGKISSIHDELSEIRKKKGFKRRDDAFLQDPKPLRDALIWTARSRVFPNSERLTRDHFAWVENPQCFTQPLSSTGFSIGLGNTIFWNDIETEETSIRDVVKSLSFCHFYTTVLGAFQSDLRDKFRKMSEKQKYDAQELETVEASLDHLIFTDLQYQRALYGLQGQRKKIVFALMDQWGLDRQVENAKGWAQAVKNRIERAHSKKQRAQSRVIRATLGFIGAISVLDLTIVLKSASIENSKDGIVGILDFIRETPLDLALYLALAVVILVSLLNATGR